MKTAALFFPVLATLAGTHAATVDREQTTTAQGRADTVVVNVTPPRHAGVAALVSEMQVGGPGNTAPEYTFTSVGEIRPLRNGSIVIVDREGTTGSVRVYDSTGKYLRTLERDGLGGAINGAPRSVAELPDGRILVAERNGGAVIAFDSTGRGTHFFTYDGFGLGAGPAHLSVVEGGVIYLRYSARRPSTSSTPPRQGFVRLRADARVIDTIFYPDFPQVGPPPFIVQQRLGAGGTATFNLPFPYAPNMLVDFSPLGYFVTANTARYAIDLLVPPPWQAGAVHPTVWKTGDRVVSLRREVAPVAIDEDERTARRRELQSEMQRHDPNWKWTGPDIPSVKPILSSLSFGLDGRMWVRLSTQSDSITRVGRGPRINIGPLPPRDSVATPPVRREAAVYDVLEPDGTYIGRVGLPPNETIAARRGDHVWGIRREADGRQTVHRFRIEWK